MLEIKNLDFAYEEELVLKDFSLEVAEEEIFAILGQSGCGKTTLLNLVASILMPKKGTLNLNGEVLDPKKHKIGLVMQDLGLLPWLTVEQNCYLSFKIRKNKIASKTKEDLKLVLKALNLSGYETRRLSTLSGGQKQRVSLGRLFLMNPELILLDEAFSSLDLLHRDEAMTFFLKLWYEKKVPTLMVSHSIDEALYMSTKIVVLDNTGAIKKIMKNPLFGDVAYRLHPEYGHWYGRVERLIRGEAND